MTLFVYGVRRCSYKQRHKRVPFAQEVSEGNLLEDGANDGGGLESGGRALDECGHDAEWGGKRGGLTLRPFIFYLSLGVSPGVTGHVRR